MHYKRGTGWVESCGGAKVCSDREMQLRLARIYGKTGDTAAFTRLLIERTNVSDKALWRAFRGEDQREHLLTDANGQAVTGLDIWLGKTIRLT